MEKPVKGKTWDLLFRGKYVYVRQIHQLFLFAKMIQILFIIAAGVCVCVCVCVCLFVCLFISVHRKGFSWLNRTMDVLPDIQASDVVLRKLLCVKNLHLHIIVNHSRDLLASNCARVSLKLGRAMRSKRQLLKLSKNQQ